jgi:hypothetical protein
MMQVFPQKIAWYLNISATGCSYDQTGQEMHLHHGFFIKRSLYRIKT